MQFAVTIDRMSFVAGSVLALLLAGLFVEIRSEFSLAAMQLPGLLFAWALFAWMYLKQTQLASPSDVLPIYFAAIAVYCINFAEQFTTDFPERMPRLHGGLPYSDDQFVVYSMVSISFFLLSSLAVYLRAATFLLVPVLFFTVHVVFGTAVAQTWWSIEAGGYFPGLVTGLANWILGPILIGHMMRNYRAAATVMVSFALILGTTLSFFEA
ncbi:hypothetical protein [Amaricoccus macauensis]|uniref:hypothetical protein n=1 Tax=Amaricoccus macauensis TaxID=57001 RepID=UPI003C7D30E9